MLCAYLMPHPPLAIPAIGRGEEQKIASTLDAIETVADEIAALAPETIIFITPHNVVYRDYFHLSPGVRAKGDFASFGMGAVQLAAEYDTVLTEEITRVAAQYDLPAGTEGERNAALDHGVMVPLYFIRQKYTQAKIVRLSPSGFGAEAHIRMGQCLAEAVRNTNRRAVLVASGDLSHKLADAGPYGFAPEGPAFDKLICEAFTAGDFTTLMTQAEALREKAGECGLGPCQILAGYFRGQEINSRLLSYEGPFGVGYAVAKVAVKSTAEKTAVEKNIVEKSANEKNIEEKSAAGNPCSALNPYCNLARRTLEHRVRTGTAIPLPAGLPPEMLATRAGAFVSLHKHGRLRGCIGTIAPTCDNLAIEIMQNAVSAGLRDNRFSPVTPDELPHLAYKVDILAEPEHVTDLSSLDVHRYGVIVTSGYRRGLLLPNLDGIDTVEQQISIAMDKAGITADMPIQLERFEVTRHE